MADRLTAFPVGASATLEELDRDPHPLLARLREREPVSWLPALSCWLVTDYELASQVMRDAATFTVDDPRFSTGQVVGPSMLTLDGTEHARHRDPFGAPYLAREVRARFTALVKEEVDRLIDAFAGDGCAELRGSLAGPLAATVMAHALGLHGADAGRMLGWYDAIVDAVTRVTAGEPVPREGREAFEALAASMEPATDSAVLTQDEWVSNAAVLLFGGIETTEGMIANAVLHLLSHPAALALVEADRGLLENAVEESLRLEPAAAVIDRYATRDAALGGAAIAAGELVRISLAGANRDPRVFAGPDRFDLRRDNVRRHVAFAHGPHICLGLHLARLEAQTALGRLLDRLPGLRLDPDRRAAPRGLVFRKPPSLHVLWVAG